MGRLVFQIEGDLRKRRHRDVQQVRVGGPREVRLDLLDRAADPKPVTLAEVA
jgi:hypothetical protein